MHASVMTRARGVRTPGSLHMDDRLKAKAEHERLMVALAARDARHAGEIMHQHDLGTARSIVASLQSTAPRSGAPLIANET